MDTTVKVTFALYPFSATTKKYIKFTHNKQVLKSEMLINFDRDVYIAH